MTSVRLFVIASSLGVIAGGCASDDGPSSPETVGSVVVGDPTSNDSGTTNPTSAPAAVPTPAPVSPMTTAPVSGTGGGAPSPDVTSGPVPGPTVIVPPSPGPTPAPTEPTTSGGSAAGGDSGSTGTAGTVGNGGSNAGGSPNGGSDAGGAQSTTGGGGSGAAGAPTDGPLPLGNPAVPSSGCGQPATLTTGKHTISSTNQDRTYIIDIPAGYDMNKPYRLFYTSHWIGSTSEAVRDQNYYFLKPLAEAANEPAIFVAPQSDGSTWQEKDHALFDDIFELVKNDLCIDTTRVFATGFSFGGMITYSLSVNHQKDIRAAVGIAPANYNIFVPEKTGEPIAWMQTTGMDDGTCPWVNGNSATQGAKFIAIEHATNNGCTVPNDIPTWQNGDHVCYDFEGCPAEFPTKACTFAGGHTNIDNEQGSNWIAQESWDFFMQF